MTNAIFDTYGFVEAIDADEIRGWVIGRSDPNTPLSLDICIDETYKYQILSNQFRSAVRDAGYSEGHSGFTFLIPESFRDGQLHKIAVFRSGESDPLPLHSADSMKIDKDWRFASAAPTFQSSNSKTEIRRSETSVVIHFDGISNGMVNGWAYDEAHLGEVIDLDLCIDDVLVRSFRCDIKRDDVKSSGFPSEFVGFAEKIPEAYFDGKTHAVSFRHRGKPAERLINIAPQESSLTEFCVDPTVISGNVDGLHSGAIRGWAIATDLRTSEKTGALNVLVSCQGQPVGQIIANQFRADVAAAMDCTPNCGFEFVPPQEIVAGKSMEFGFRVVPAGFELPNSPYRVTFAGLDMHLKLHELTSAADLIFSQLWSLRAKIKELLPRARHTLRSYDMWAREYQKLLNTGASPTKPKARQKGRPQVSIICPTFRPRIKDFVAAIKSVLEQTFSDWELIIVDDASDSRELKKYIKSFTTKDPRIKAIVMPSNGGISTATNAAIAAAKGEYVAFFDHDDLLAERAIEIMVDTATQTGAKLLYCDEDKIDDEGVFSEVNLKPDWNYRLLLCQNYVCHLLFVERAHLLKVGPLRSVCDGAQDHDLILRLSEIIPAAKIVHVPEVLYHWRKTPTSTAGSIKSKTYAVNAGLRAVTDHIARKGLKAAVKPLLESTIYEVRWRVPHEPKVTIIIPYREFIGMTRECVELIRTRTDYKNYQIVLVDNWSVSKDAFQFAAEMNALDGVKVITVRERFNFSRLNNIAVAKSRGEFLLFMNNDVFVRDRDWLSVMVGEAIADPSVGIVGIKLAYPNGLVQHGGIVLGVGGIGDHAHRGLSVNDPGYMARAICAQEMSAVTAACMLCRRDVFEKVGGFDERDLCVAFNDVDLCLKVGKAGYRLVWTPTTIAEHRESMSRGNDFHPQHQVRFFHENKIMADRWGEALYSDRAYNPHFSRDSGIFADLADPSCL